MIPVIHQNIFLAMQTLIEQSIEMGGDCAISCVKERDSLLELMSQKGNSPIVNDEIAKSIKEVWTSAGLKATWERRAEFQVITNVLISFEEENGSYSWDTNAG
jgi:hypothetical protein